MVSVGSATARDNPAHRRRDPKFSSEAFLISRDGRRRSAWTWTLGIASEFIEHLPDILKEQPRIPIVLYVRVSSRKQLQEGNLEIAKNEALMQLRAIGVDDSQIIAVLADQEHSGIHSERGLLETAAILAETNGAVLVALTRDRFLRSSTFEARKTNSDDLPAIHEYRHLLRLIGNVRIATIHHPDDTTSRSRQIKTGQHARGRSGGRPSKRMPGHKKERRTRLMPTVLRLCREGNSLRVIETETGVPKSTSGRWAKEAGLTLSHISHVRMLDSPPSVLQNKSFSDDAAVRQAV